MANRIVVFDHKKISVWCYPDTRIIHHQIHQYTSGDVFHDALTSGIEAMRKHRGSR